MDLIEKVYRPQTVVGRMWEEMKCRWKAEIVREKKVNEHIQLTEWQKCIKLE
jgi:hypothetical protein